MQVTADLTLFKTTLFYELANAAQMQLRTKAEK